MFCFWVILWFLGPMLLNPEPLYYFLFEIENILRNIEKSILLICEENRTMFEVFRQ